MPSSTLTIRVDEDLKREAAEVADYYGLDLSSVTSEIGIKLGISSSTAKKHLENVYRKAGVNNRMSMMKFAQHYVNVR